MALCAMMCACLVASILPSRTRAQELKRRDAAPVGRTPVILSQAHLAPPLHSRLRALRYSPDGKYILLQDEATAYVLTRSPLAIQLRLRASRALPVRFTADSKAIVVPLRDLRVRRWDIETGDADEPKKFTEGTECFDAALSPHATYYACLEGDNTLRVFRVDTSQEVFNGHVGEELGPFTHSIQPLHAGLAHSEPFGYYMAGLSPPPFDRTVRSTALQFSPDEHYVLVTAWRDTAAIVDLQVRKKIGVAGSFRHAIGHGGLEFVANDRVAYVSNAKAEDSAVLSFPKGDVVAKLNVTGSAEGTSDPRYMIHFSSDGQIAELFEVESGKLVSGILKQGGDVFGNESVSYTPEVGLAVTPVGKDTAKVLALVPPSPLEVLRTAMASPDLKSLVLGITGDGGIFRVSDGKQTAHFTGLTGAWFNDEAHCDVRARETQPGQSSLRRIDTESGGSQTLWPMSDYPPLGNEYLMSGPVVLSQSGRANLFFLNSGPAVLGYKLSALDRNTGQPLWTRDFGGPTRGDPPDRTPPVPFDDPQGERIVLGWEGNSEGAKKLVKGNSALMQALKQTKAAAHDTLFEVLDARTGNYVGMALVLGGSGPESYTSAFSAGDWLILVKDEMRITAVSLSNGDERLKLTAFYPALYGPAGLLAVAQEGGHLVLYDLNTGQQRDVFDFPSMVVYSRFSADGRRMLVLTQDQSIYVLDLATALAAPPPKPSAATSH